MGAAGGLARARARSASGRRRGARGAVALSAGAARAEGQLLLPQPRHTGVADPTVTAEGRLPESCARALQAVSGLQTMPWSSGMLTLVSASC